MQIRPGWGACQPPKAPRPGVGIVRAGALSIAAGALCASLVVTSCSDDRPPPATGPTTTVPDASSGGLADASESRDTGGPPDATASAAPLGTLPTVDEPEGPCVTSAAKRVVLFSAGASFPGGGPPVRLVQPLGAKR